jgi:mannose-6-phosphate isomerase
MIDFDNRPWGRWEEYLYEPTYRVKRLVIFPGKRISLQLHQQRREIWVVVAGSGLMTLEDDQFDVKTGDVIKIEREQLHRIANTGEVPLVIIETQQGICPEEDITRIEDDFGRA